MKEVERRTRQKFQETMTGPVSKWPEATTGSEKKRKPVTKAGKGTRPAQIK
jgi:hypothetical protein